MGSEAAVGIDLGTTFSVIAYLDNDGKPQTLMNLDGELTTPSAVYFDREEPVVGREALKVASFEPDLIAQFAKRDVGRTYYHKRIHGQRLPPELIQALVLRKLQHDAAAKLGDFSRAVVTVPAYFNEPRRKSTMDAGHIAGLEVLDIINEPTAAAVAYGVQSGFLTKHGEAKDPEIVLVYDLGGGTFDVTLMEIGGFRFRALATAGDVRLGGIDWDRRIVDHIAEQFKKEHGVDPRRDSSGQQVLMQEAEEAKRSLSSRPDVTVYFTHDGNRIRIGLSRAKFENLTQDLMQRTIFTVNKVLREGKMQWPDVTRVLLVGGSTRMPAVCKSLAAETSVRIDRSLSPDEAVAHGAALYAGFLLADGSQQRPEFVIENVNSHDLGVLAFERSTGMQRRKVLIARNTRLPAVGKGSFVTRRNNQSNVLVNAIEGGDASGKHATAIGKCIVSDLPPGLPAGSRVLVRFRYESNGRLTLSASVAGTGRKATMHIERASGLTEEAIRHWKERVAQNDFFDKEPQQPDQTPAATSDDVAQMDPADSEFAKDLGEATDAGGDPADESVAHTLGEELNTAGSTKIGRVLAAEASDEEQGSTGERDTDTTDEDPHATPIDDELNDFLKGLQ